jgi:type IX secretion system PorP/SprF family membrane protein
MRRWLLYSLISVNICWKVGAQDPQFTQFYSNPLYLAPSFAGMTGRTRLNTNYRIQWPDMPGAYHTYSVSLDHAINSFNSGLGLLIMNDRAGSGNLNRSNITLQYAYYIKINEKWHCVPGIYMSYMQRSLNFQSLVWHDQISTNGTSTSSVETLPVGKVQSLDFGTSAMFYSEEYWLGTSVDHLFQPNESFYIVENTSRLSGYIPIKYSIFGGTKLINKGRLFRPYDTSVQLAFLYRQQKNYKQLDLGMYWYNKPLVLGFWYRGIPILKPFPNQDAFALLVGIKLENFNIGYSYDFTISKLIGSTGGTHEISMSLIFKAKMPKRKLGEVPCPDF